MKIRVSWRAAKVGWMVSIHGAPVLFLFSNPLVSNAEEQIVRAYNGKLVMTRVEV